ncbi:MAG TPA: NAD(P)/FAD-dependent oxidoreductase, partial [Ktedonobacterales bacterium]|nr:NAD(P)/FAD-dependent oxidoreductase [Ktedonobacterales bacterium]
MTTERDEHDEHVEHDVHVEHVDVVIVGAGLSGIAAAYYLQTRCPTKTYVILEGRDAIGGTWDLFRYPGIRSDSDMYTLGYSFRPWREAKAIAEGPAIRDYIRETAKACGIDRKIRFGHQVRRAAWSSADATWTVDAERASDTGHDKEIVRFACNFLYMCTGYYDYAQGYTPSWPGVERFSGRIVHPQQWPEDLDYAGKRIVVIGSGATAVTLVPALAKRAAHVTMLQRSPTYIVARPSEDAIAVWLLRHLPATLAHQAARWKSVLLGIYFYNLARRRPDATRRLILRMVRAQLGPDYDVETHFAPRYNPWDQRLCLVPDANLFAAMKLGKVSVATDHIETFTETGIRLRSGEELAADIIVTATGLSMKLMSGARLIVDGAPVDLSKAMSYKGMMYSDVPNLASAMGYTNASWTLKCELISAYVCRLLNYMERRGYAQCIPRKHDPSVAEEPLLTFTSGYIQRVADTLPHQGSRRPWKLYQNYALDLLSMRFGA